MSLGLDFGTSSVKVVIGDDALGKAFAVPFFDASGLEAYLLPSRIYQTGDSFSLDGGDEVQRDLKLSLLADPLSQVNQQRVVALLALAVRRARGWLFVHRKTTYLHTRIAWKITVGIPAASNLDTELSHHMEILVAAAWRLAAVPGRVNQRDIQQALEDERLEGVNPISAEVAVIPEISAQIYGFVVSHAFDKKAPNKYLMVDVGAGTVDSSLFHVKRGKGNKWDFEFYTAVVEPNGTANLHRHRANWWTRALTDAGAPAGLLVGVEASKLPTDQRGALPPSFKDYFDGIEVTFRDAVPTPDAEFFDKRILAQVRGKTLWRSWKNNLLERGSLRGIPFFLCGGGALSPYYLALEPALTPAHGFSWLEA